MSNIISSKQVTPFISGAIKPFHVGIYQRKTARSLVYAYWDGKQWMTGAHSVKMAMEYHMPSIFQTWPWRGLANPVHSRRNIGPVVSKLANKHPWWPHSRVLARAKALVTAPYLNVTRKGQVVQIANPQYDPREVR